MRKRLITHELHALPQPREIVPLFDKILSRNLLHFGLSPNRVKFTWFEHDEVEAAEEVASPLGDLEVND